MRGLYFPQRLLNISFLVEFIFFTFVLAAWNLHSYVCIHGAFLNHSALAAVLVTHAIAM